MSLTNDEVSELTDILATIGENKRRLAPREREFIEDMERRLDEQGADQFITPKQWQWLRNIYERF